MTAVLATFVDIQPVRTRGQVKFIFEVPVEQADAALKTLGGIPQPAQERWVGIALAPKERKEEAKKGKRSWDQLSPTEQAGIRCAELNFGKFLHDAYSELDGKTSADAVRDICGVQSRSQLSADADAAESWSQLEKHYQEWLTDQRYADSRR